MTKKIILRIKLIISHIKIDYCNLMESIHLLSFIYSLINSLTFAAS